MPTRSLSNSTKSIGPANFYLRKRPDEIIFVQYSFYFHWNHNLAVPTQNIYNDKLRNWTRCWLLRHLVCMYVYTSKRYCPFFYMVLLFDYGQNSPQIEFIGTHSEIGSNHLARLKWPIWIFFNVLLHLNEWIVQWKKKKINGLINRNMWHSENITFFVMKKKKTR